MTQNREIETIKISPGEYGLREKIDLEDIHELVQSVRRLGIIEPLIVEEEKEGYTIIAGHRRYEAACAAGLQKVPCIVRQKETSKAAEIAIAENLFRKDLSPLELACALKGAKDEIGQSVQEIAAAVHHSPDWVRRYLAIIEWPPEIQQAVHVGDLSVAAAENLACVGDEEYRKFLVQHAINSGATARLTAAWLQSYRAMQPPEQAIEQKELPPGPRQETLIPHAPCIICQNYKRTDELAHIPICVQCLEIVKQAQAQASSGA